MRLYKDHVLRGIVSIDGGRGSVVRELEFKSENPGFDPLVERGEGQWVFLSLRFISCADLFVPDHLSCVRLAPKLVRTFKIPYPSVVKE